MKALKCLLIWFTVYLFGPCSGVTRGNEKFDCPIIHTQVDNCPIIDQSNRPSVSKFCGKCDAFLRNYLLGL